MKDKKTVAQILGENLKRIRTEKGVSRKELAEKLGVSQTTIASYENGIKTPMLEKVFLLAEILKVSITDLTGDNPNAESGKVFEYRLQRAYQMARDFLDSLYNAEPNFDKEGRIVIFTPAKVQYKNGVVSYLSDDKGNIGNSVAFKSKADFVKVMEQAERDALRQRIEINSAFRQIVFGEEPPK